MSDAINQHKALAMGKNPSGGSGGKASTPKTYSKGGLVKKGGGKMPSKGGSKC